MNKLDLSKVKIDESEIKKIFTEQELRVVSRFLDYVQQSQSKFSGELAESEEDIKREVQEWIRIRRNKGHYRTDN